MTSAAIAFALGVAGCGGSGGDGEGKGETPQASASTSPSADDEPSPSVTSSPEIVDPNVKLAEVAGRGGLVLTVHQIKRDTGGFITVNADIKNPTTGALPLSGMEGLESSVVANNPNSVAGATLVDPKGKKRYYVLRDTDNRCLCTTGLLPLQPDKSTPVFMQFPSPPDGVVDVDLTLPTFAAASLKISG